MNQQRLVDTVEEVKADPFDWIRVQNHAAIIDQNDMLVRASDFDKYRFQFLGRFFWMNMDNTCYKPPSEH